MSSYESDDEAPEEESVVVAEQRSKKSQADAEKLRRQQQSLEKSKRRTQNEKFRDQRVAKKQENETVEELPLELLAQAQKDAEAAAAAKLVEELDESVVQGAARKTVRPKKTLFDKGPVKVKVLSKQKKLAPKTDRALSKRDQVLNRHRSRRV